MCHPLGSFSSLAPHYRTGILSDTPAGTRRTVKKFGLDESFDAVVLSAAIKAAKPDPRAFAAVLNAVAVRPDRTAFVDNTPANIDGAAALGMHAVLCTTAQETVAALKTSYGRTQKTNEGLPPPGNASSNAYPR